MLSVANVRSPSAAASYFAADNYYTGADADRSGTWVGKGAERLGLEGRVSAEQFDALLRGELPGGIQVGNAGQAHRPGTDLTFSLPKSWSLLALVGGDQRIVDAYREAVIETLRWAEKNAAQTRMGSQAGYGKVAPDNLTIGLFQHDTNRNQEADDYNGKEVVLRLEEQHGETSHYSEYRSARYILRRSFTNDFDF